MAMDVLQSNIGEVDTAVEETLERLTIEEEDEEEGDLTTNIA